MKKVCNRLSVFRWVMFFCLLLAHAFLLTTTVISQEQEDANQNLLQEKAVKVYLDVSRRFEEYIKTEIPFVNYVRDRKQAQVYIMMTEERTGAGGNEYTIKLIGQMNFVGVNDTLKYVSRQMDTEEMTRSDIVKVLKRGLIRYVEKTPLADYITISYRSVTKPTDVIDKWDYWVFNIRFDPRISGESSRREYSYDASFSADRVTPNLKISLSANYDYEVDKYKFDDEEEADGSEGWDTYISDSKDFRSLVVKSLGNHWSAGGFASITTSTYRNIGLAYEIAPALEFNVFPYSDYTRREFRFLYKTVFNPVRYDEETIYGKMKETLFYESLSATFELKERWGSLRSTLEGSHYFHDFNKNRLELYCNLNLRLFEGFSLDFSGDISIVRDQLSLPQEGATEEEILLHRKQIATDYDYRFSVGLRYTFGSIYSNVVNPRFGSGDRHRGGMGRWY